MTTVDPQARALMVGQTWLEDAMHAKNRQSHRDRLFEQMATVLEAVKTDMDENGELTTATVDAVADVLLAVHVAKMRGV